MPAKLKDRVKHVKIITNQTGGVPAVKKAIAKGDDFIASVGVDKSAKTTEDIINLLLAEKSTYKVIQQLVREGHSHQNAMRLVEIANNEYQLIWSLNNPMITLDSLYQQALEDHKDAKTKDDFKAASIATKNAFDIYKYTRELKDLDNADVDLPVPVFAFHPEFFPHIHKIETEGKLDAILARLSSNTERKQNIIYLED